MKIFVVTNTELGWDCVTGVFKTYKSALTSIVENSVEFSEKMTIEQMEKLKDNEYDMDVIHEKSLS